MTASKFITCAPHRGAKTAKTRVGRVGRKQARVERQRVAEPRERRFGTRCLKPVSGRY